MKDVRVEKLANNLLTYSVDIQKGDNILIEILGEDGIPLVKELIKKAEELGEKPYFNIIHYEVLRVMLQNATEEQIKLYGKHDELRMKDMQAYIGIRATSNNSELNGYITYNTETTYNGILFQNIKFEFKDGKIVKATSNRTKELNEILDTDEGARYIGEFAFGLNPYIEKPIGDTLFDEKIKGSFHFTPGDSLAESDNGNRSSIHWDIVNIQTPEYGGGEIYFDNVLIRKDGKFVLPELECLNPENLI